MWTKAHCPSDSEVGLKIHAGSYRSLLPMLIHAAPLSLSATYAWGLATFLPSLALVGHYLIPAAAWTSEAGCDLTEMTPPGS